MHMFPTRAATPLSLDQEFFENLGREVTSMMESNQKTPYEYVLQIYLLKNHIKT